MKTRWPSMMVGIVLWGCANGTNSSTENTVPEVDNAATRYVTNLQRDVQKAESAVNRMNRASERTENAINQSQGE